MIPAEVNETLSDLLEVYRVKVTGLEESLDTSKQHHERAVDELDRARRDRDRAREEADRNHKLVLERARTNVEMAEKVKKLEGVIESLHIELQNEREAHQATKDEAVSSDADPS